MEGVMDYLNALVIGVALVIVYVKVVHPLWCYLAQEVFDRWGNP